MSVLLPPFLLALSGALVHTARGLGGPAWVLAWPALSAALLALAYLLRSPGLLGKRRDGTRPAWAWALFGPYLAFTAVVWHLARLTSRESPLDEVAPGIWVGRRVLARELPERFGTVIDLTAELDAPAAIRARPGYRCLPTLDASAPASAPFAALVEELAAAPDPLFIHCAQGHGRSATLAAALVLRRGLAGDPAGAEALLRRARPGIGLKPAQRRLLLPFAPGAVRG